MADDSDSQLLGASIGGQDRKRIILLNSTIELLSPVVCDKLKSAKRFSVERRFWGKLQTFILNVEEIYWQFKMFVGHTKLVETLLFSLDSMIHLKDGIPEEFEGFAFPHLETLRETPQSGEVEGHSIVSPEMLIMPEEHESFKIQLGQLEEALMNANDSPLLDDVTMTSNTTWKKSMWPILRDLLTVVSSHWKCTCKPHQAALLLFTHRTGLKRHDPVTFTMLFRHEEPLIRWQESSITVKEKIPNQYQNPSKSDYVLPKAAFSPIISPISRTPIMSRKVQNLCDEILPMEHACLDLNINGKDLYRMPDSSLQMNEIRSGEIITLSKGILQSNSVGELSSKVRICLAVVLSWSLLDFCDEPWFRSGWTKDTIHMMQHDSILFLRPLIVTEMCSPTPIRRKGIGSEMNEDLLFLHHGLLLMEIFRQEPFEASVNIGSTTNITEARHMLLQLYRGVNWDVHERYQQSVKACIDVSRTGISNTTSESSNKLARAFCEGVIGPLQAQYEKDWGNKDPDEVIANIKLRIHHQPSHAKKFGPSPQSKSRSLNIVTPLRASTARKTTQRKMAFYDSVDKPEIQQIKSAQGWFNMFDDEDIGKMLPKRPRSKNDELKIAVLDTGINMELPNIRSKRGRIKCWPNISACRDEDGHGTHVAYLLLRLAPHTRLLVSKVSKSSLLIDADIQMIADAITHYSSGEDKADIINLSFGFPFHTAKQSPIREALIKACENNVLVFAAAGNSGGNELVSWPASMTSHVLRIDSSDGKGNPSAFSSGSGLGRKLCTLGEGVPSCELKAGSKTEYIYRSGTSFATPIAAAIASIVLAFSAKFKSTLESTTSSTGNKDVTDIETPPEDEPTLPDDVGELVRRLRTKFGMEEILCQMCAAEPNQARQGYHYITPWFFLRIGEQERIHVMLNHLRRVSC